MSAMEPLANRDRRELEASATREGHTKALAELYRTHHRSLLRLLTARTGSRDTAKEVLQEAYARLLELDRGPETSGFLKAYLWKIAQNLATDHRRREATRARLDPEANAHMASDEFAPSAEEHLFEQQSLELLEQAIDDLPANCLEAFILRIQHGLSFREVAQRMNIGERMAQLHVSRALHHCQSYLDRAAAPGKRPK